MGELGKNVGCLEPVKHGKLGGMLCGEEAVVMTPNGPRCQAHDPGADSVLAQERLAQLAREQGRTLERLTATDSPGQELESQIGAAFKRGAGIHEEPIGHDLTTFERAAQVPPRFQRPGLSVPTVSVAIREPARTAAETYLQGLDTWADIWPGDAGRKPRFQAYGLAQADAELLEYLWANACQFGAVGQEVPEGAVWRAFRFCFRCRRNWVPEGSESLEKWASRVSPPEEAIILLHRDGMPPAEVSAAQRMLLGGVYLEEEPPEGTVLPAQQPQGLAQEGELETLVGELTTAGELALKGAVLAEALAAVLAEVEAIMPDQGPQGGVGHFLTGLRRVLLAKQGEETPKVEAVGLFGIVPLAKWKALLQAVEDITGTPVALKASGVL